jgi:hypothetical protein
VTTERGAASLEAGLAAAVLLGVLLAAWRLAATLQAIDATRSTLDKWPWP